jgi:hypothetical protein
MRVAGQPDLPQIVAAAAATSTLPCHLNRRQEQAYEQADDGNHHQQLNQRKTTSISAANGFAGLPGFHRASPTLDPSVVGLCIGSMWILPR